MMTIFKTLLSAVLLAFATRLSSAQPSSVRELVEAYFEDNLVLNPIEATYIGDERYNERLPNDIAPDAVAARIAFEQRYLDAALRYDMNTLGAEDRLTWEIFVQQRRATLGGSRFPAHLLPVNQLYSLPLLMPMLASGTGAQPFRNARDYDNFRERLRAYPAWSDQAIANMREGMRRRIVQPRVVMERLVAQLDELIADDAKASLFYEAVRHVPATISAEDSQRIAAEYEQTIRDGVLPAYRRLRDFIRQEYLSATRTSVAWTALPQGPEWYAHRIEVETTTGAHARASSMSTPST